MTRVLAYVGTCWLAACGGAPFTVSPLASLDEAAPSVDVDAGELVEASPLSSSEAIRDAGAPEHAEASTHRDAAAAVDAGAPVDAIAVDAAPDVGALCCVASCPNPKPEGLCPGFVAACLVRCP